MFSWTLTYYISEWAIRLCMLVVVIRRRDPTSAKAWLLLIFFLPWVGLVVYLMFGDNRLPRRRLREHARLRDKFVSLQRRFQEHPSIEHPQLGPEAMTAVRLAENLGYMPILGGNEVEFLAETDAFIDRLVADIDAAQQHVNLLFYIYANDRTGRKVSDALTRAVERGVKCRLLADGVGSRPFFRRFARTLRNRGVDVREALPVSFFRRKAQRIDLRNHRKIAVIDGRIAYTGSQNIVDADYGRKHLAWRDLMARLTGPAVLTLQAVFIEDWYFDTNQVLDIDEHFPDPEMTGETPVQTLPSGPNFPTANYQRVVVAALHAAQDRVTITTPYFVPDEAFMQALETAVLRGVDVELILPLRSDQILVGAASRAYYDDVLNAGVTLYLHDDGLLHSKTITIDNSIAFFGTSNLDIRSFALNFEINLVFYGARQTAALRTEQEFYIRHSCEMVSERWRQRPALRKIFQNIAKLLSPLL